MLADALSAALADVDETLRGEYPALFAAVDALKADPGRTSQPTGTTADEELSRWTSRECPWCGDNFATLAVRPSECCSIACARSYAGWNERRLHPPAPPVETPARECERCGTLYVSAYRRKRFCTDECRRAAHTDREREKDHRTLERSSDPG